MGISLPCADVAFLLDSDTEADDIIQKMFRALTDNSGKKFGFIVDVNIKRIIKALFEYDIRKDKLRLNTKPLTNQERIDNGLDELEWGKYLYKTATANSRDMATSGQLEYPSRPAGKEIHRAAGYSTTDGMANATLIIWKGTSNFAANFLIKGARYGAVGVYKSGDIFYITYMADFYQ